MSGTRKPTWEEVKARSVQRLKSFDAEVYCGDCTMAWRHAELPCRKHATPEELVLIDEHVEQALARLAMNEPPWVERTT